MPEDQFARNSARTGVASATRSIFVRMAGPKDTYDDAARWLEAVRAL